MPKFWKYQECFLRDFFLWYGGWSFEPCKTHHVAFLLVAVLIIDISQKLSDVMSESFPDEMQYEIIASHDKQVIKGHTKCPHGALY
jgi:hypothetical protein